MKYLHCDKCQTSRRRGRARTKEQSKWMASNVEVKHDRRASSAAATAPATPPLPTPAAD